jgi:hypothetical protein
MQCNITKKKVTVLGSLLLSYCFINQQNTYMSLNYVTGYRLNYGIQSPIEASTFPLVTICRPLLEGYTDTSPADGISSALKRADLAPVKLSLFASKIWNIKTVLSQLACFLYALNARCCT